MAKIHVPTNTSPHAHCVAGLWDSLACMYSHNQAATYPVTCLGHVRVLYILTNMDDVGKYDL